LYRGEKRLKRGTQVHRWGSSVAWGDLANFLCPAGRPAAMDRVDGECLQGRPQRVGRLVPVSSSSWWSGLLVAQWWCGRRSSLRPCGIGNLCAFFLTASHISHTIKWIEQPPASPSFPSALPAEWGRFRLGGGCLPFDRPIAAVQPIIRDDLSASRPAVQPPTSFQRTHQR
jgi:hypothetical protein